MKNQVSRATALLAGNGVVLVKAVDLVNAKAISVDIEWAAGTVAVIPLVGIAAAYLLLAAEPESSLNFTREFIAILSFFSMLALWALGVSGLTPKFG
jgi:hypothetical protein